MQLILIRHGESVANQMGVVQGHFDSPLNEQGRIQAQALAASLAYERFDAIYASDLARAHETGRAVADRLGLALQVDPRIREIDVGVFSGLSWQSIAERYPEEHRRFVESGNWALVPKAEGEEATRSRLDSFMATIKERHPGGRVAIVAHGAVLRRLIHVLLELPFPSGVFFELHNTSTSEIHLTPKGPSLLYLNRIPQAPVATATTRSLI
ncbi:histidine phosphatase family protein [bacterium]|nr:histidine phosphatase family protein [bacterium]